MTIVKFQQIKHNNNMKKRLCWWIIVIMVAVFSFQPVLADDSIENISTDIFTQYTRCQKEKLQADPLRDKAEIVEECQAENVPTNCNPEGGLGWLICPAIFVVSSASDISYAFVRNFMDIDVDFFRNDTPTFQVWSEIRNIANIGLILFFLFMIFSQMTGFGMNNYNIKKTLPKFIMAVILVNLSFMISQFLIDISNIVGSSMVKLINSIESSSFQSSEEVGVGSAFLATGGTALAILLSIVAISTMRKMNALLSLVMPILTIYILAMITTGIMLLVRKAAVIALIAISPIAFLSLIFPRTEAFYNKWKQGMTVTLVAFPVIALLFGASGFVSKLITHSSSGVLMHVLGLAVSGVPMFIAPSMIRKSVSSLPAVGNSINNFINSRRSSAQNKFNNSRFMDLARKKRSQGIDDFLSGRVSSSKSPIKGLDLLTNQAPRKLSTLSNMILTGTRTGQSILKDIDDRRFGAFSSLANQLDETDSNIIMQLAENDQLSSLDINSLSDQSKRAIYAAGLDNDSIREVVGAAMLQKSQAGEISEDGFRGAMSYLEDAGINQSVRNQLTEQSRQGLVAKGRTDMDALIRGLSKTTEGISKAGFNTHFSSTSWKENTIKNHLATMGADDLAKISHKSFNPDFSKVYSDLYKSDPNFAYSSEAALKDPNLSAKTAKEIIAAHSRP